MRNTCRAGGRSTDWWSCRADLLRGPPAEEARKRRRPGPKRPPPTCKEERELRQSALDPWLLATSLSDGDAAEIVRKYASRMQIEETFRDAKSHRFGWALGTVRLTTPDRAAVL